MKILYLPLKTRWFNEIKAGTKLEEYRDRTPNWAKKIVGREYDLIVLTLGYPRRDDLERRIVLPWRGYTEKTIHHPHFGPDPIDVYAIDVSGAPLPSNAA
jgi:hypothetical protein